MLILVELEAILGKALTQGSFDAFRVVLALAAYHCIVAVPKQFDFAGTVVFYGALQPFVDHIRVPRTFARMFMVPSIPGRRIYENSSLLSKLFCG